MAKTADQQPAVASLDALRRSIAEEDAVATAAGLCVLDAVALSALPVTTSGEGGEFAFKLLARAIQLRDEGGVNAATRLLEVLHQIYPHFRRLPVELLLIHLHIRPDLDAFGAVLATVEPSMRHDGRVLVMEATAVLRRGEPEAAGAAFAKVDPAAFTHEPFFAALWFDLLLDRLRRLSVALGELLGGASHAEGAAAMAGAFAMPVRAALEHVANPAVISERLLALVLRGPRFAFEVVEAAILSLPRDGRFKAKAQGLSFLVAFRRSEALAAFASAYLPDPALERHPQVLHVAQSHAALMTGALARLAGPLDDEARAVLRGRVHAGPADVYAHVARKVLARDDARAERPFDDALASLPRRSDRAPSAPSPGAPHLFVGVFGQLRFPERLLPALRRRIADDLAALGGRVSFGLATWTEQGRRSLRSEDAAFYIYQRLPDEIAALTAELRCETVGDLARVLPRVVAQAGADDLAALAPVSTGFLRDACGWDEPADIAADSDYLDADWPALHAGLGDVPHVKNQGRMWNRLAALSPLLRQAERRAATQVDAAVLLRADLELRGGGFAAPLRELLASAPETGVRTDADAAVELIGGVGDRMFLAGRRAADQILAARDVLQALALSRGAIAPAYKGEVPGGHVFPGSLLFEAGLEMGALSPADISFEIYRGRLGLPEIAEALRADVEAMRVGPLRAASQALLRRIERVGPLQG